MSRFAVCSGAGSACPNGAMAVSPGMRGTSYPGNPVQQGFNRNAVAAIGGPFRAATPLGL